MKNWLATSISVVAFAISIVAMAKVAPIEGLDFDYYGAIIGVLSFLVTLLMGYQIYTVINVKKELDDARRLKEEIDTKLQEKADVLSKGYKDELIVGHNNPAKMPKGIEDDFLDNTANIRAIVETVNKLEKKAKKIIACNRMFFDSLGNIDEVKVYGHSIEEVDMPYFEEVRKGVDQNAQWHFYCHDDENKGITRMWQEG